MHPIPSTRPACFIVGCSRSGTTLLSVLLDRHSDLCITPETNFYNEMALGLNVPGENRLRSLLSAWPRLPELGLDVETVMQHCGSQPTREDFFSTLLGLYARRKSKAFVGEKTPQHLNHVPSMVSDFPQTPIVCIVRDGREVALSLRSMPWSPGDLQTCAQLWLNAVRLSTQFQEMYPNHFRVIFYEDLITRPTEVLGLLMKWFGLEFQISQLSPEIASDVVLSRSLKWKGQALTAIDNTRVHSLQDVARADELHELNELLGSELIRLGYKA